MAGEPLCCTSSDVFCFCGYTSAVSTGAGPWKERRAVLPLQTVFKVNEGRVKGQSTVLFIFGLLQFHFIPLDV